MIEKRKIRIGPLTTVGQVAGELGRLYRQARRGDVAVADASQARYNSCSNAPMP